MVNNLKNKYMILTILQSSDVQLIFRMLIEATDNVYEHEVNENCKYPSGFQNDYVVQNTQKLINADIIAIAPETPPVYEPVPTFDTYFDGVELIETNPLFVEAVESYLHNEQGFIFS